MAFLDENGVLYFWGKVKSHVSAAINAIVIPSKTSDLTNDSGFITSADVPEGAAASATTQSGNTAFVIDKCYYYDGSAVSV